MPTDLLLPEPPTLDEGRLARIAEREFGKLYDIPKAIGEYKRFLILRKAFPEEMVYPGPQADVIWHLHILDTRNYAYDCNKYFGHFLHHDPCPDDRTEDRQHKIALTTERLYRKSFGELPPELREMLLHIRDRGRTCR